VTQVVKSDMRQLCTPQEGLAGPLPEIGGVDEFTDFARKHKVLILVETTRFQLLLCLPRTVASEGFYDPLSEPHGGSVGSSSSSDF
jgi:hypothetical protein